MKLDVEQKVVCELSDTIIENILGLFTEEDWHVSDYRNSAGGMSKTNTIPILHTPLCKTGQCDMGAIKALRKEPLYDKYFPHIQPILDLLKQYYEYKQYAIFITRLAPKAMINPHPDTGNFLELCNRIHVPLKTNPDVKYLIDKNSYYWERGKIYEFDNTRVHGVYNNSDEDRIHLIINLYNLNDDQLQ